MPKDDVLNFRVPRDLKLALKKAAEQDERSMSTMAARILREWLTDHGFLRGGQAGKKQHRRS
jgi:hypothetical protein